MSKSNQRNPNWTREETMLALALYLDCGKSVPMVGDPAVLRLSELLRNSPLHPQVNRGPSFRSPTSVVFKINNIHSAAGGRGFENNSKLDRELWSSIGSDARRVREVVNAIELAFAEADADDLDASKESAEFVEGGLVTVLHRRRERSPKLRKRVLDNRVAASRLNCDCCGLSPNPSLKSLGCAVLEVHHLDPLGWSGQRTTRLKDLALLCANCHRLMHAFIAKKEMWLSVRLLKEELGY